MNHSSSTRRGGLAAVAALMLAASLPLAAGAAGKPQSGFKTLHAPMLAPGAGAPAGVDIKALMTVGDTIGGYRFESIPDGIAFWQSGRNEATVWVNHETSTVPFPYNGTTPTTVNSFNDFDNSQLSQLVIRKGGQILSAEMVIDAGDSYHRFCSNFLATTDGFESRPLLFTNEEGIDWVPESGNWTNAASYEGAAGARQIGAVVAYDPATGAHKPIWGMGRHNHENTVAIPGYGFPFLLSGDDAFNQNAPQSQLYAYIAEDADAVWDDEGDLWAFVSDVAGIDNYYDFLPDGTLLGGGAGDISGHFVKVDKEIAMGKLGADASARDVLSTDFVGHPLPPSDGTWQRPPGATSGPGVDGPQWVLEHWGDSQASPVFQFLRIEDIAYDKRPGMSNVIYLADSGRASTNTSGGFASTNGRIWKMVLDPSDPKIVTSLSVLIEGDDSPGKVLDEIHQPDNLETTVNGLYITEDPSSINAFVVADQGLPNATTGRVWQYRFSDGALNPVLMIDQSADEGPTDMDAAPIGRWGDWEASGIIDVSSVFGPGKFLIVVQAHGIHIEVDTTTAPDNLGAAGPDWTFKREGGQLLLVTIPGG